MSQFHARVFLDPTDGDVIISIEAKTNQQCAELAEMKKTLYDLQSHSQTRFLTVLIFNKENPTEDQRSINLSIH